MRSFPIFSSKTLLTARHAGYRIALAHSIPSPHRLHHSSADARSSFLLLWRAVFPAHLLLAFAASTVVSLPTSSLNSCFDESRRVLLDKRILRRTRLLARSLEKRGQAEICALSPSSRAVDPPSRLLSFFFPPQPQGLSTEHEFHHLPPTSHHLGPTSLRPLRKPLSSPSSSVNRSRRHTTSPLSPSSSSGFPSPSSSGTTPRTSHRSSASRGSACDARERGGGLARGG